MSDYRRYQPPHLTVKLKERDDEASLLFRKINVELTPQPQVINFLLSSSGGELNCAYDPAPLIGEVIHYYAWLLCPPAAAVQEYAEKLNCRKAEAKRYLAELYCDRLSMCVGTACNYARAQVERYFLDALNAVHDDSVNHTYAARNDQAFRFDPVEALVKVGLKGHRKKLRRSMLLPTQGGKRRYYHDWTDEECVRLADRHEGLMPLMKWAKALYKKKPADYMDLLMLNLSQEALENLANPDSYLSSPSNLALISATQSLGLKPGLYKPRTLKRYLIKGRKLKKSGHAGGAKDYWSIKVWL